MENLSHSGLKKACNANGFGAKTVYHDVFGGPPEFGIPTLSSRAEDYSEIFESFHASRASSVPFLDLPPVEADFSFDVRSSMFDYSEVFGGSNGLDFAVSFEELFNLSRTAYDSSDEVWTPAQSESLSDESDPSASSERSQGWSNGESHQSCDGIKQFNISHNESSQSMKDMSSGTVHVTQLRDVPGFTFVVNETPPSQKIEDNNALLQLTDDLSGGLREGKLLRKTMSHPPNSSFDIRTLGTDLKPEGKTASYKKETFVTVSDISLRTQPSRLPPPLRPAHVLAVNDGDSDRPKPKLKASKSFAFGERTGESLPPFFDVEVDASSSAAASAAAMKDVMEKAQAKLKSAKESMERKKECLHSHTKLGLKNDTKDKGGRKTFDGSNSYKDGRVHGNCQRDCSGMIAFAGEEGQKVMKTTQVASNSIEGGKHINVVKISADRKHGKESRSSQEFKTEGTVAWREVAQFYEVVEMDKSKKKFVQAKDERVLVQNTETHQHGQEKRAIPVFQQQEEDSRKMKADREAHEWEGNKGRSEVEKKLKEANEIIEDGRRYKDVHEREENERRLKESLERGKYEERLKGGIERAEIDKRRKEALEQEEKEQQQREASERKEKEKRQKEAREREENENRLREAREIEEKRRVEFNLQSNPSP